MVRPRGGTPILVTGVPRSGTTWLARLLATAPGTALAGREPMNPRGRQYALAGTLTGWVRLDAPTGRQRRALRSAYLGLNPRTYGRYGRNQWRAPLPWTRVVVKDPFAMLSVPAITRITDARTVQVYRHPGAVLASYRRMGWRPDLAEIAHLLDAGPDYGDLIGSLWARGPEALSEAEQMGVFWAVLNTIALAHLAESHATTTVVAHHELAAGGLPAAEILFERLGLRLSAATDQEMAGGSDGPESTGAESTGAGLHRLHRNPADVADSWRKHLTPADVERIETITGPVLARMQQVRLALTPL